MSRVVVELEQEVVNFVRSLPPQPRQAIRRALKNLQLEQGDIRALELLQLLVLLELLPPFALANPVR